MSQPNEIPSSPESSNETAGQKSGDRRRPDSVSVMVRLRTATGARTVETQVSPLATDAAAIDLARRREGIVPEAFRSGEVIV